jgi:hypothetical protein
MLIRIVRAWLLVMLVAASLAPSSLRADDRPDHTVVVLLFDGWAPSLVQSIPAPALERMRKQGAWTHKMLPAFPTISLINQTTISTGCWPEHHGIVTNVFLDPQRGEYDHSHDADWLIGCEHLHQAAERQGVRSAALGWVGRYSTARGNLATHASPERAFAEFPTDQERTDQVVRLLQLPDADRPRLILAYFKGPDGAEHFKGMDSDATRQAAVESDACVGKILDTIAAQPFHDRTTLIVTTDHGMIPVTHDVNISKILLNHKVDAQYRSTGTTSFLYFADRAQIDRAFTELSGYKEFDVVRKNAQPADWHIGTGPRVGDLIISTHPPYFIEDISRWPKWAHWLGTWGPEFLPATFALKATHGYPADTPGIAGIFYVWGAGVAAGHEVESMRAIDIHPTVTHLLGIAPGTPVDGQVAQGFLTPKPD